MKTWNNDYFEKIIKKINNGMELKIKITQVDYFLNYLRVKGFKTYINENRDKTKEYLYINSMDGEKIFFVEDYTDMLNSKIIIYDEMKMEEKTLI